MTSHINFYTNAGKLVQYITHFKDGELDYVVSPAGKRLSQSYGKRVYGQSQKGVTLLSEVRGHGEEVPRKYRHMLSRPVVPKRRAPIHVGSSLYRFTNIKNLDIDLEEFRGSKLYYIVELKSVSPDPKDPKGDDDRYYMMNTGYMVDDLLDNEVTEAMLFSAGDLILENEHPEDEIVGLAVMW